MPKPTKEQMIRASESLKQSAVDIEEIIRSLISQGRHEEAMVLDAALKLFNEKMARIRVNEDGKIVTVQ